MPIDPDPKSPQNTALAHVDALIQGVLTDGHSVVPNQVTLTTEHQMGVLIMALVLATRRFLKEQRISDRGRRMKIVKAAVDQFDSKLREFVAKDATLIGS